MALTSPGVEVTIIDESQYLPAPTNSIPLVLLATAENKADATGTGVASATTAANAGKLFQVTSQRDLVTLYGSPFFYQTSTGTPIQGYELNEYGLLAAYSLLGVTNRCYILRADIDLASLVGRAGRPTGAPDDGTYWLDTTNSTWGIYVFNATTGRFTLQTPIVITDPDDLSAGVPLSSIGSIGQFAVNAIQFTTGPASSSQIWYKTTTNTWVGVTTTSYRGDIPTIVGSNANPTITPADTFNINVNGQFQALITAAGSTAASIATTINNLGWTQVTAEVRNGKLNIFSKQIGGDNKYIQILAGSGTILTDLGITAGIYYQPYTVIGPASEQPVWQAGQTYPHPTGSVWIKTGSSTSGLTPVLSRYSETLQSFVPQTVPLAVSDWDITSQIDSTGGAAIPEGSIYGQYRFNDDFNWPLYLWRRVATGPTVVTGTNVAPSFTAGPYTASVYVSIPGSDELSSPYTFTLGDNTDAEDFVIAWSAAGIPNTSASVTTDGAIQLSHDLGGEIVIDDSIQVDGSTKGTSNGLLAEAGFVISTTDGCKFGPSVRTNFSTVTQSATSGVGTGAQISIDARYGAYIVNSTTITAGGSGYVVGDTITYPGASLGGSTPANNLVVKVTTLGVGGAVAAVTYVSGSPPVYYRTQLSNWREFTYTSNEGAPVDVPADGTNWYYSEADQVDIMVNYNGAWKGYKNQNYDLNGFPTPTGTNATDPDGPIISASEPTTQSDGTALVYGDLWIDTSDLENYPVIYRWQQVDLVDQWVLIDNTDGQSSTGIIFEDARWGLDGTENPADDPIPTIVSLLTSNYLDIDAPESNLHPTGMLLWNTRRSGYNVKQYKVNWFNSARFPDETLPDQKDSWVSASGLKSNGAPYMGRKAQRAMVVEALRSAVDTNFEIRDEDNAFNLMACPNYPELQPNLVVLNADRGETGYILGDTPMRLPDSATDIQAWATNAALATSTGEDGCVTRNTYLGLFYPSGIANDLSGNEVAVPSSHMMLRTFLRNDTVAYPWFAAAGVRRGTIDNALNIGYIQAATGEFQVIKTRLGIRDTLYSNFINPLVFFTGNGLLNYGNKTSFNSSSALDRTNVARLIAYIRRQLTLAARPFVFEQNDAITRKQIAGVIETLMVDLVAKRGIYDYLVVCDESNNTPARIDRNELWVDVAIEPVKAAEFIYVPVRVLNTGELSNN
jgi:Phage tail sheath C-terminal domain